MFGRKRSATQAKPHFGEATVERRPMTADDVKNFFDAADEQDRGEAPTIYDLEAMCRQLAKLYPVDSRATIRQLKWLMSAQEKHLGGGYSHPWK